MEEYIIQRYGSTGVLSKTLCPCVPLWGLYQLFMGIIFKEIKCLSFTEQKVVPQCILVYTDWSQGSAIVGLYNVAHVAHACRTLSVCVWKIRAYKKHKPMNNHWLSFFPLVKWIKMGKIFFSLTDCWCFTVSMVTMLKWHFLLGDNYKDSKYFATALSWMLSSIVWFWPKIELLYFILLGVWIWYSNA